MSISCMKALEPVKTDQVLGIILKTLLLLAIAAFAPAAINELRWLYIGKKVACTKVQFEYEALVMSSSELNKHAFTPGEGSAINQAFTGTVLASSTQSPNAKLIQATIYGCGTNNYTLQRTTW